MHLPRHRADRPAKGRCNVSDNSTSRHDESELRQAQAAAFDCSTMVLKLWVRTAGPHIPTTAPTELRAELTLELDKLDRVVGRFEAAYPKVEECLVRAVTRQRTGLVEIFGFKWAIAHEAAAETARKFQHARHFLDKPKALYALAWDIVGGEAGRAIAAEFDALDEHIRQEYLWGIADQNSAAIERPSTSMDNTMSSEARALGVLTQHTDWSIKEIAYAVGVNRTTLYTYPLFVQARKIMKANGPTATDRRRGRTGKRLPDTLPDTEPGTSDD
jgi:hypothetical protein